MPPPVRADVGARRRAGGRLVSVAGVLALAFIAWALIGAGSGGRQFFDFFSFAIIPPIGAAMACIPSGRRLARNFPASRITAALAGGALTVCAGWWIWIWSTITTGHNIVDRTQARLDVEDGVIVLIALIAALGVAMIIAPGTGGGTAPPLRVEGWEVGTALIASGVVATIVAGLSYATVAERLASHDRALAVTRPHCGVLFAAATHDLASLDYGGPMPPVIAGATIVGAALVPADASGWTQAPGIAAPRLHGTIGILIVEQVAVTEPAALEPPARGAISDALLIASDYASERVDGHKPVSMTLPYEGQGIHGSVSYARCHGRSYAVVFQQVRPDRVGVCHHREQQCAEMYAAGAGPLHLAMRAVLASGSRLELPAFEFDRAGSLVLSASADDRRTPVNVSFGIEEAMRGWHEVRLRCDGGPCNGHSTTSVRRDAVGIYRKGDMTATVALTARSGGDTHVSVRIVRPV
ncbi:MAG: hypothetical protein QOC82_2955 [Frankiaceae bacterium]|jgi:hypothetical protein|nr:hypothetical protein [Frankiaceae bacterium]